jgi:hypothetical protein
LSLVTKIVTGDFLQLTFKVVGREGGWVKNCFLSLRQTVLLSDEGKKSHTLQNPREPLGRNQTPTSGTETKTLLSRHHYLGATTKGYALIDATRSAIGTRNSAEVEPYARTLDIAKGKPKNPLKMREQSKRDRISSSGIRTKTLPSRRVYQNEILPSRKNYLCAAAEGNNNSTEGHTHKGRGATEREDDPTDRFSRARTLNTAKRKPNNVLKRREQSKRDQILSFRSETKTLPSRRLCLCAAAGGNIDTLDDSTMGDAKRELVAARAKIASLKANRERQGQELNFPNRPNNGYRRSDDQSSSNHSSSARRVPYKQNQF